MDTKLTNINGTYKYNVYWKNTKLSSPWTSKTPKCYKWNIINGDLHYSRRISSNFRKEISLIKEKFMKTDYPLYFNNSVLNEFQKGKECGDDIFIIPPTLFETRKSFIFIEIPYCGLNEIKWKHILQKFKKFANNNFRIVTMWTTRNIQSLLPLKEKNDYKSCGIVLVVHVTLLKPNVMQKLDRMNIIIQL